MTIGIRLRVKMLASVPALTSGNILRKRGRTMDELKEFERTGIKAELNIKQKMKDEVQKAVMVQIASSINHLEISLDKFLQNTKSEELHLNKQEIDNIYYHIGAIKGCL
jgi:hypothetical protein